MSEDTGNRLADVRQGMRVVDAEGADVGSVESVQMGDPQAVTTQGEGRASGGLVDEVLAAFTGGADVHPQMAARLLRKGYLKIDTGLVHPDRYAAGDQVADVVADVVHLTVRADDLAGT